LNFPVLAPRSFFFRPSRYLLLALLCARLAAADPAEVSALRIKAEKGNALAQYNLGLVYLDGALVPADLPEAFVWLTLAAENGSTGKALNRVLGNLTDAQLAEGRRRLAGYRTTLPACAPVPSASHSPLHRPENRGFSVTAPTGSATAPAPAADELRPGNPAQLQDELVLRPPLLPPARTPPARPSRAAETKRRPSRLRFGGRIRVLSRP
jgi:hypothetical protein